jgi:integrase
MATIFREKWRRPIPDGAQITERRGKKVAGWTDSQGRRQSAELDKDGKRIVSYYPHWFARYRDADGVMRRVSTGCTDSQAAKQFLAKIVTETEKVKVGIISREESRVGSHSDAPLARHIEDYATHLRACERNADHIQDTRRAILRVANDCDFKRLRDVQRIRAERWLLKQAELGMSARTRNTYRIALVAFGNWCVRESRLLANPFAALPRANEAADRRRERRALKMEEIGKLLKAAEERPLHNLMKVTKGKRRGQPLANLGQPTRDQMHRVGQSHAMFYRIAIFTGLRYSEIKSLKVADAHLDANPPHLDLHAKYDKARRGARQPLSDDLVVHLRRHIAGRLLHVQEEARFQNTPCPIVLPPDERLIPHVPLLRAFNMDLEYAGIEKKDDRGRTLDIHSLRHTFGTLLALSGVMPRTAMELMRHSDIRLTTNIYQHLELVDTAGAVNQLPTVGSETVARKTGTYAAKA